MTAFGLRARTGLQVSPGRVPAVVRRRVQVPRSPRVVPDRTATAAAGHPVCAVTAATVRLSPSARSALETDVVEGWDPDHDPPAWDVLRRRYDPQRGAIDVSPEEADVIAAALTELANTYDAVAQVPGMHPVERTFARAACRTLTTAATRVLRVR